MVNGKVVYRQTPQEMAAAVPEVLEAGATIVGSCCGSTPEHTAAIRRAVDDYARRHGAAGA
jgi:5-methyltetrahydrofolate--homocysteine methyltransferase